MAIDESEYLDGTKECNGKIDGASRHDEYALGGRKLM